MRQLGLPLAMVLLGLLGDGRALAQPKICGNQSALGSWNLGECPQLKDDGAGADESAGDGIYSLELSLDPTALLEYKILPQGTWVGALGQQGSCDHVGNPTGNDTANVRIAWPLVSSAARFYLDTRTLSDPSDLTPPGNRSIGDSLMFRSPQGDCPRWFVVGDFQSIVGVNGTAVELAVLRPGVLVGRHTASKLLPVGWKWKVMEQASVGARELGPSGWAYAPCSTPSAAVSTAVMPGSSIYFVIDTRSGRLRTVVSDTPLDGFVADGTLLCPKVVDMASPAPDLASKSDASTAADLRDGELADAAFDGPTRPLPGIHCDCQLGGHAASPSPAFLTVPLLLLLRRFRRLTPRT
jgi:hypothetical protein